jgi:hypothetical protein
VKRKLWEDYPAPIRDEISGCLRWQGTHHAHGYGLVGHKYAQIPPGLVLDHVATRGCIYRDCVEVDHLEVVTQKENVRRGKKVKAQIEKTHCPKGHPYHGDNLIVRRGKRECRACTYARNLKNYYARKANKGSDVIAGQPDVGSVMVGWG